MKHHLGFTFLLCLSVFYIMAQNDSSNFRVGIFAGYYIPGSGTAPYYNGSDNNRLRDFMGIQRIENQIKESFGGYDFELLEYARDMRYNNAASFELQAAYLFGHNWNVNLRFHSVNLAAAGIFTLRVNRTNQANPNVADPYLEEAQISGKESRSHIALGIGKEWLFDNNVYVLTEGGVDLNFVKVKENKIQIADVEYTLPLYTNVLNQQASPTTTIGSGFFFTAGVGVKFQNGLSAILKGTYINTKINLNDVREARVNVFIPAIGFTKLF
jgi:hypothetical protein